MRQTKKGIPVDQIISKRSTIRPYFDVFNDPVHITVRDKNLIVAHACLIERWLQFGEAEPMRTAYVEAVATDPKYQGRGFGTAILMEAMIQAHRESRKPFLIVNIPGFEPDLGESFCRAGVPFFQTAERAMRTYALVRRYQLWREKWRREA